MVARGNLFLASAFLARSLWVVEGGWVAAWGLSCVFFWRMRKFNES